MDTLAFFAVIAAAAFHAGWNALLKLKLEPLVAISLISFACGLVTLPLLPFVALPRVESWPYIAASLALHFVYYITLAEAYRTGDLGQVYPIARGTAPLLTAVAATVWLGEELGLTGWAGIGLLGAAILMLSARGGRDRRGYDARAVGFALATAVTIAAYTVVDGTGARLAGAALPYIVWLLFLDGLMMLMFGLVHSGPRLLSHFLDNWQLVIAGGALSTTAYGIVIWAMTVAPIALVAALRETSVLFAALIAVVFLGEPPRLIRAVAALLAVAGALLIRYR